MSDSDMTVDRLLHDAERADAGSDFANAMGDHKNGTALMEKRDRLIREALAIDPDMTGPEWSETNLMPEQIERARHAND